jgi:hypothetical protein
MANDIIVAVPYAEQSPKPVLVSVTAPGLTFARHAGSNSGTLGDLEIWWAHAPAPLTVTVTAAYADTFDDSAFVVFAANGCNTSAPFATTGGLPAATNVDSAVPSFSGISTTQGGQMLIFAAASSTSWSWANATGFGITGVALNSNGNLFAKLVVSDLLESAPLSSATISYGVPVAGDSEILLTALVPAAPFILSTLNVTHVGAEVWFPVGTLVTQVAAEVWFAVTGGPLLVATQVGDEIWFNNPPTAAIIAFDGVASSQASGTQTISAAITTTQPRDIIGAVVYAEQTPQPSVASVTAPGLTFARHIVSHATDRGDLELWWAMAGSPLDAVTVTVAYPANFDDAALVVFAASGCNTNSPWDTSPGLPGAATSYNTAPQFPPVWTGEIGEVLINASATYYTGHVATPWQFDLVASVSNGGGEWYAGLNVASWLQPTLLSEANIETANVSGKAESVLAALVPAASAGPTGGAHRFWRLFATGPRESPTYAMSLSGIAFAGTRQGPNLLTGGTIITGGDYNTASNPPANLLDGDTATWWASVPFPLHPAPTTPIGAWWGYDFGVGTHIAIEEMVLTPMAVIADNFAAPADPTLQWSDDGLAWTTVQTFAGESWDNATAQYFDIDGATFTPVTLKVTHVGAEVWFLGGMLEVTQVGVEVWLAGTGSTLAVTQVGCEAWMLNSPPAGNAQVWKM